jgi:hypothetical protein
VVRLFQLMMLLGHANGRARHGSGAGRLGAEGRGGYWWERRRTRHACANVRTCIHESMHVRSSGESSNIWCVCVYLCVYLCVCACACLRRCGAVKVVC